MKKIQKPINEPQVLTDFKDSCFQPEDNTYINCDYENFQNPQRRQYKEILLREQGFLCAYCNKEIGLASSSIEHWLPQHECENLPTFRTPAGEDLNHDNLIAVCFGNNGNPYFQHCDKVRGGLNNADQFLHFKPQHPNYFFEATFTYVAGKLVSINSAVIQDDVDRKLNLNHQTLVNYRNITLSQFIKSLNGNKDVAFLNQQLNRYNTPTGEGKLRKYCTVVIDSLNKKLA